MRRIRKFKFEKQMYDMNGFTYKTLQSSFYIQIAQSLSQKHNVDLVKCVEDSWSSYKMTLQVRGTKQNYLNFCNDFIKICGKEISAFST